MQICPRKTKEEWKFQGQAKIYRPKSEKAAFQQSYDSKQAQDKKMTPIKPNLTQLNISWAGKFKVFPYQEQYK